MAVVKKVGREFFEHLKVLDECFFTRRAVPVRAARAQFLKTEFYFLLAVFHVFIVSCFKLIGYSAMLEYMKIPSRIYMVGIGGIGMSALAQLFAHQGKKGSGSDRDASPVTTLLAKKGIEAWVG